MNKFNANEAINHDQRADNFALKEQWQLKMALFYLGCFLSRLSSNRNNWNLKMGTEHKKINSDQ